MVLVGCWCLWLVGVVAYVCFLALVFDVARFGWLCCLCCIRLLVGGLVCVVCFVVVVLLGFGLGFNLR